MFDQATADERRGWFLTHGVYIQLSYNVNES